LLKVRGLKKKPKRLQPFPKLAFFTLFKEFAQGLLIFSLGLCLDAGGEFWF
jgi:hypothetical protein